MAGEVILEDITREIGKVRGLQASAEQTGHRSEKGLDVLITFGQKQRLAFLQLLHF